MHKAIPGKDQHRLPLASEKPYFSQLPRAAVRRLSRQIYSDIPTSARLPCRLLDSAAVKRPREARSMTSVVE